MEDYILFLDEANATVTNKNFCLGGIIIKRSEYEKNLIPQINTLKNKYFGHTSTVFHYTDMKKNREDFSIFRDGTIRSNFWNEITDILNKTDFTTIGTYLCYDDFCKAYCLKANKHYEVAFVALINNYIKFLKSKKALGSIIFEARQWKENKDIQNVFYHILVAGTDMYSPEECNATLSTIGFITKKENCIGLQIADFVPDSFVRRLSGKSGHYNLTNTIHNKLFTIDGAYRDIVGLRKIL